MRRKRKEKRREQTKKKMNNEVKRHLIGKNKMKMIDN